MTYRLKALRIVAGASLAVLVGVASLLAGCGGGDMTTVTVTESTGSEETSELQEQVEDELAEEKAGEEADEEDVSLEEGDCDEKEISTAAHKEGTCVEDGVRSVVVNMNHPLKLKTLEVELKDFQERKSIAGEFGESSTANGVYVTFELAVTNLAHAPLEFAEDQSILLLDESIYTQDFDVQNGIEARSFLWAGGEIQPQSTVTATITFDVPSKVVKKLTKDGNLDFVNFGAEYYEPEEFFEQEEYGTIRTYK